VEMQSGNSKYNNNINFNFNKKAISIKTFWFCVSDGSGNPLSSEAQQRL